MRSHTWRQLIRWAPYSLIMMAAVPQLSNAQGRCGRQPPNLTQVREAAATALRIPLSTVPDVVVSVADFGACPDDAKPDAVAIERAANNADGALVFLPPGRYVQEKGIRIGRSNVVLFGPGAVLDATNAADYSVALAGDGASAANLELRLSVPGRRTSGSSTVRLQASGKGNLIIGNVIRGSRGAAVAMFGARDFRVSRNTISDTLADGIHVTRGSLGGIIDDNEVAGTGDDLIAVVSYRQKRGQAEVGEVSDIVIRNNTVGPNRWGRGIAVIGGRNITISDNTIVSNASAAGIMIAQEKSYGTYGVRHVIVERNVITDRSGGRPTGEGSAIQVNGTIAGPGEGVRDVVVRNNTIRQARYRLFSAKGNVCGVVLEELNSDAERSISRNEGEARCSRD